MGDLFDLTELRIRQPGKVLPARATYEFFDTHRNLTAIARETQGRSRFEALANEVPSVRSLDVTTARQQPVLTLVMRDLDWLARLTSPDGKLIGRIRVGETKRYYTLLDDEDKVAGEVSGDLSATKFAISGPAGERYAPSSARPGRAWARNFSPKQTTTPSRSPGRFRRGSGR